MYATGRADAQGKLFLQTEVAGSHLPESLPGEKADNQILAIVMALSNQISDYHRVALVSKDINIRIKARALGLYAEDYTTDKVLEDSDVLYSGHCRIDTALPRGCRPGRRLHRSGHLHESSRSAARLREC